MQFLFKLILEKLHKEDTTISIQPVYNEPQPQIFACKLLIKNLYTVFENRWNIAKHNGIFQRIDIFLHWFRKSYLPLGVDGDKNSTKCRMNIE